MFRSVPGAEPGRHFEEPVVLPQGCHAMRRTRGVDVVSLAMAAFKLGIQRFERRMQARFHRFYAAALHDVSAAALHLPARGCRVAAGARTASRPPRGDLAAFIRNASRNPS
jgi:hypothetical protein